MMYSSETGSWKTSGVPFAAKYKTQYDAGVYWNGAVNWFNCWGIGDSVYYNVDDERSGNIPLPPIPEGNDWYNRQFRHYWESRGHLHLVEVYDQTHRVDVQELERDYSGWFLKFCVDLDAVGIPRDPQFCHFSILCVVRMERDEESLLVLHVPGKILRYFFGDGTLNKICDVAIPPRFRSWGGIESRLTYPWCRSFQYNESLFGV
ncbi:F-box protein At5g07610-like [Rhododendron vialii]|uniref:F-box protein At5g07610-like n=1 Tax=Rhododendron vialii TaxID=182163 RepID=UPI00265E1117|nr:F-box protein At5g07610-like [Rhododendron vialii]